MELTVPAKATSLELGPAALRMAIEMTAGFERDIIPLLPPAQPGRKVVTRRNAAGSIQEVAEYPPTLAPEVMAAH